MSAKALFAWTIAIACTLLGGGLHGHLRHRWGASHAAAEAVERLRCVPTRLNEWEATSTFHLSDREQIALQSFGHVGRVYRNQRTGEVVRLSLLLGPFGPTAAHTPEACLGSGEFAVAAPRTPITLAQDNEFWSVGFRSSDVDEQHLRVLYSWTHSGAWTAPEHPRLHFAASPYLFKLSLSCSHTSEQASLETCRQFLAATIGRHQPSVRAFLVLGRIAHDQLLSTLGERRAVYPFRHGAEHRLTSGAVLFDSYHCSRYNTNTGVLTEAMFEDVVGRAAAMVNSDR